MNTRDASYLTQEFKNADGTFRYVLRDSNGQIVREDHLDTSRHIIETKNFTTEGSLIERTVYVQDGQQKPQLTTTFDAEGNVIWYQERGKPPVISKKFQGEKPFSVSYKQSQTGRFRTSKPKP